MKNQYLQDATLRLKDNLPPLPLNTTQVKTVITKLIIAEDDKFYLDLFTNRILPGVDDSAKIKVGFLADIIKNKIICRAIDIKKAYFLLSTMLGGYNVDILIDNLTNNYAVDALSNILLVYDSYNKILLNSTDNKYARQVLTNWANADWFLAKKKIAEQIKLTVFRVDGEINTDDLSPATEAWSRPDIPLHAKSMLSKKNPNSLTIINKLKQQGNPLVFVGDVVGTGSSRKSAINSILWHIGDDIDFLPNKRIGGVILADKIAPIFFNTAQDAGILPIECDVSNMQMGDEIIIYPYQGKITKNNKLIAAFDLVPNTILDEVRAGGRINLIIGRTLTDRARKDLNLDSSDVFVRAKSITNNDNNNWTLAQKIAGKACGVSGITPGTYCEPKISSVGSQDTTGAMTRDELKELACISFNADLVMQSFCHTAAYPRQIDLELAQTLPEFFTSRGGIALKPGDGVIHSWLNRMILPDTVGTGGDSHTRFPMGISFPAGSGLVAFAASMGVLPLNMPESVLVRFTGVMQQGITLRDLVNAIPYIAIKKGLLTLDKKNKKNIFSGRILEIEGLENLTIEQAFELSDASAERSAGGCTIKLNIEQVASYLKSNVVLLSAMINNGYKNKNTLQRRINDMQKWLDNPQLLTADKDAKYAEIIDINMSEINEPLLACPNDPDDIKPLSMLANTKINEVFIGSCMTNIGHFRAASQILSNEKSINVELWIAPPTKMDEAQLKQEGSYDIFNKLTKNTEPPGCSLCMGNQARVKDGSIVISTSTRNFPNRLGNNAKVYLASAELSAVSAKLGRLPSVDEYQQIVSNIDKKIYNYLSFDKLDNSRINVETTLS